MAISELMATDAVADLKAMAFFPDDQRTRQSIGQWLMDMVDTQDHLEWLVKTAVTVFDRWPGWGEIRKLYTSRFDPLDRIDSWGDRLSEGHSSDERFPVNDPVPWPADELAMVVKTLEAKLKVVPPVGLVAQEKAVLDDPEATPERKEVARTILRRYA